jgi:hypothetical protein
MNLMNWVALWSLIATQVGVSIGIYKYFNARINRVYERLDEVKTQIDANFVKKELCKVMHDSTASSLTGVESRMNDRFDRLEERVEAAFNMIISMLKK